jgi:hypothetical protein
MFNLAMTTFVHIGMIGFTLYFIKIIFEILQFGGKQKKEEVLTTIQVRKDDVAKTYEFLKDIGISMTMKDFYTFALNHIKGVK